MIICFCLNRENPVFMEVCNNEKDRIKEFLKHSKHGGVGLVDDEQPQGHVCNMLTYPLV